MDYSLGICHCCGNMGIQRNKNERNSLNELRHKPHLKYADLYQGHPDCLASPTAVTGHGFEGRLHQDHRKWRAWSPVLLCNLQVEWGRHNTNWGSWVVYNAGGVAGAGTG